MSNDAADLLEFIRTNQSSENRVCEYKKGMSGMTNTIKNLGTKLSGRFLP